MTLAPQGKCYKLISIFEMTFLATPPIQSSSKVSTKLIHDTFLTSFLVFSSNLKGFLQSSSYIIRMFFFTNTVRARPTMLGYILLFESKQWPKYQDKEAETFHESHTSTFVYTFGTIIIQYAKNDKTRRPNKREIY